LININILRINCAPSWFYLQDYKVYLVSGNMDKLSIKFEAIFTPFQHHKSYLFMATDSMYTKRGLYSTQGVEMNFRGKKKHDMTEWPAVK
jgi:hypothetical protein